MSFRLVVLVVSIGLADSLNPGTVAPALYLSTTARPRVKIAEFAAGVFVVNLLGGALIALGPGQLLLALVPRPGQTAKHLIELMVGTVILVLAVFVLLHRDRLRRRRLTGFQGGRGSGFALGAGVTAVELPTAFPYFAAIAAIVGSDANIAGQIALLSLFNVAFLLPVLGVLCVLLIAGDHADSVLARAHTLLERHWPTLLAALLLIIAAVALGLGISGLLGG